MESMAFSKIVLCYLREEDLCLLPRELVSELPIINVNETNLEDVLIDLLGRSKRDLEYLGRKGRQFFENWHEQERVGKYLLSQISKI